MKAISLTRPWPWCILYLGKRIENRHRSDGVMPSICRYRGEVLLHAAKSWDDSVWRTVRDHHLAPSPNEVWLRDERLHPPGAIVGRARAVGHIEPMHPPQRLKTHPPKIIRLDGLDTIAEQEAYERALDLRWWQHTYALLLTDVEPALAPVPCKGALGCWKVPPSVEEQLRWAA